MKTVEWTPKRRSRALGLVEGRRHSLSEISQITNIPDRTLYSLRKRNTPLNKVRSGRPSKLSPRHKRQIVFHITRNHESRRLSTMSIIQDLQLDIGITQLKHTLKDLGYNHRIARRRPFLKKLDRKRRLQFAKRHAHFTLEDWKAFLWTDEMSVKVGMQRSTRDWVWRREDEEFHPDCIDYRKHATGTGMMFWGAFRWGRMGPGVFFELEDGKKVNSTIYRDQILTGPLQEFWEASFEDVEQPVVMEDNAPPHKKVCIPVRQQLGMKCHQHPPNSPDLNPIENIWAHMKHIISKEYAHITSQKVMKEVVVSIWNDFGDHRWDHLVESMPERIQAVIKARGGSTRF
jgi:transposase